MTMITNSNWGPHSHCFANLDDDHDDCDVDDHDVQMMKTDDQWC